MAASNTSSLPAVTSVSPGSAPCWKHYNGVVRLTLLLCLALPSYAPVVAGQSSLQNEDLQAVKEVLRKQDPSLDWFHTLAKKPADANHSVMLIEAAPSELRPGASRRSPVHPLIQIGVFVVYGKANQVRLLLDRYPLRDVMGGPRLDQPSAHAAYLHFYSDYGMYHGSIKYIFGLSSRTPPLKIRYGVLALTPSTRRNGKLRYTASFGQAGQVQEGLTERHAIITIEPRGGDALPGYKIEEAPASADSVAEPAPLRTAGRDSVLIANTTPPGQTHQDSGIYVIGTAGTKRFFPVPTPTMALHRQAVPHKQAPGEIQNDIGPFVLDGTKVWFANTFYDSEGLSGVGAVGAFDVPTRKYEMRYLPEIAPWSGSAILLDGEDLWVGLMRRPEGANYGAGLLRYNSRTGAVAKYAIPDVIYTIDRLGDTLYCGTSHGLYTVRGDKLTQLRFEPSDGSGRLALVAREVR